MGISTAVLHCIPKYGVSIMLCVTEQQKCPVRLFHDERFISETKPSLVHVIINASSFVFMCSAL